MTIRNVMFKIKEIIEIMFLFPLRLFPVKNNKIFICNDYGRGFGDNPKYICNELLKKSEHYDIVWAVKDLSYPLPEGIRGVKYKSLAFYYEMTTSGIWIDNCRKYHYMRKRKNQYYIQTYHGDVGIKKAEGDAIQSLSYKYIYDAINDSKMIDLFISGNRWMTEGIRRAYWYSGKIAEIGSPRRDIFYNASEKDYIRIRNNLGISCASKVLLYAPTFRKGQDEKSLDVYRLDWKRITEALEKRFGGKWVGLIRLHPNLARFFNDFCIPEGVINVNEYPDMKELLIIAVCCMSDYSSTLFEFAVTGKPGFIYAEDVEEYKNDRGLHFTFDQIPFTVSTSNEELAENILAFNEEEYSKRNKYFFKDIIGIYDDGTAYKKIVEIIENVVNENYEKSKERIIA